jgi:hypothetical protein
MLAAIFRRLRALRPANHIPPLGRWCIKDKTKNNWKIDMANVDHCGTCATETQKPVPLPKPTDLETPLVPKERSVPPLP